MERHDKLVAKIYSQLSSEVIDMIKDDAVCDFLTVLKIICHVSSMVELLFIDRKQLKGLEKKNLVVSTCRIVLEEHINDDIKEAVLSLYDTVVDDTVESVIEFAKNNKIFSTATKVVSCC